MKYGNTITLIDATYKTTKYDLALFFLCVRTNVNYTVVAEFIVQCESANEIADALTIIRQWNPDWSPPFFKSNYSEAEHLAITQVFPQCTVYLCDFHCEQAWERWVRDHGLELLYISNFHYDFIVENHTEKPSTTLPTQNLTDKLVLVDLT